MRQEYPEATKTPCNECPWRRDSVPGWLGPHDAYEWTEAVHSEGAIACHKTVKADDDWDAPNMRQCAGAAQYRRNVHKMPRNPSIARAEEADHERVFSTDEEFIVHHTRFEEWLKTVPVLALKAIAEDMPGGHEAKKPQVIKYILSDRQALLRALESRRIHEAVLAGRTP